MFNQDALNAATNEAMRLPDRELARRVTLAGLPSADLTTEERAAYCAEASARLTRHRDESNTRWLDRLDAAQQARARTARSN